jgi:hypothetical protein
MAMSWGQFTAQPNGTRIYNHGFDQCVALANQYHEEVIAGTFVPVPSAYMWWTNFNQYATLTANYTQSATPVAGAIFVGRYGIYNAPHGHIGVVTSVNGGTFDTMEQNGGQRYLWRYTRNMANILGFLIPKKNPANQPIAANQRQVGANPVKRRQGPSTTSAELPDPLQPGTVGNFDGWINGEQVNDGVANTNIWYRGTSGNWFWAGGFTRISGDGLTDLNPPKPVDPAERVVGSNAARRRADASTKAAEVPPMLNAGQVVKFAGWRNGEKVTDSIATSDVWFQHADGWWAWAGAFTSQSVAGLKDVNPVPPVPPVPPTPGRLPVSETTPNWDASAPAENPVYPVPVSKPVGVVMPTNVAQTVEAVSVNGYTIGRPDKGGPNHIVLHHTGGTSLSGAVNTLRGTNGAPTANWVVQDRQLVEMVPETSGAWTNGRWTSNLYSVTFEMVNDSGTGSNLTPPSKVTMETTAWAMARAAQRWNIELPLEHGINVFGHKDVSKSPTACPGGLDIAWMVERANQIIAQNPVPTPGPDVDVLLIADAVDVISGKLDEISTILRSAN